MTFEAPREGLRAVDVVARLRARGFDARRLEGGLPEWRAAGLPVAKAPG